jgi:branched-chain amino acid transport system permease protein
VEYWLIQALNGVAFGMLLFLLAAGLSLIFGVMRVLNLAHGSFYLLGSYVALTVSRATGSFILALLAGSLVVAALGVLIERVLLSAVRHDELGQVLLTFGLLLVGSDVALLIWGGTPEFVPRPAPLTEAWHLAGFAFPSYRLLLIVVGLLVAAGLWFLLERTLLGAMLRAAVDDMDMARALGVRAGVVYTTVFGLGAFLAGLGGVLGGPITGASPGIDLEILVLAFVVVIIGGLGSLGGTLAASLVVGLVDTFGKVLVPELALFTLFGLMALVLAFRPQGLAGSA